MEFPGTKQEFDEWWVGKTDVKGFPRTETCPIARFIESKVGGRPVVGTFAFSVFQDGDVDGGDLPDWAVRYQYDFDRGSKT